MEEDRVYFIKDEFYKKFHDCGLMKNTPDDEQGKHGRPCFYAKKLLIFFGLSPFKVEKYTRIYEEKIQRYKVYDGIVFGYVNGEKRAFFIQNIFPITENYVDEMYKTDKSERPVTVNNKVSEALKKAAEKVIRLNRRGIKISITDLDKILSGLIEQKYVIKKHLSA